MQSEPTLATLPTDPAVDQAAPPPSDDTQCPRCHKPLIDPTGLGWCKACGYCRSLEAEKTNNLLAPSRGPTHATALAGAAGQIPVWFWVLLLGVGGVVALSFWIGDTLPAGNNLRRALWTTVQIGAGLLLMLAGQFVAVMLIAPEDEKLSFKDAIVPTRLMGLILKRVPRLAPCLWTSAWGVAMIVSALVFIGGLNHWFRYLPNSKNGSANQARYR